MHREWPISHNKRRQSKLILSDGARDFSKGRNPRGKRDKISQRVAGEGEKEHGGSPDIKARVPFTSSCCIAVRCCNTKT